MWKTVCSPAWQLIPSTGWPVAAVPVPASRVPASAGPAGTGTPSGPSGPGAGAGLRVPSVLNGASESLGVVLEPPVTASVIPTTAAMTMTAAPATASQKRRRLRRASSARNRATFSRARSCLSRLLFDTIIKRKGLVAGSGGARGIRGGVGHGRHRGADDAGVVEQRRGHDAGPDPGQPRHPLVRLLADPAAHDDQVRREQRLDVLEVLVDPAGPLAPAQVVQFVGARGRTRLRVVSADFDV